jgi:hypothetical protein
MKKLLTLLLASTSFAAFAVPNGTIDLLGTPLVVQAQISNSVPRPNNFSYSMPTGDSTGLFVVFQEENNGNNGDYPTSITYGGVPLVPSSNTTISTNNTTPKFLNVYVFFLSDSAAATRSGNTFSVTYFDNTPKNNASYIFTVFTLDEVKQDPPILMCSAQQTGGNLNTNDSIACASGGTIDNGDLFLAAVGFTNPAAGPPRSNYPDTIVNRASNSMWHAVFFHQATVTEFITPYAATNGNAGRFILLATIVENINTPPGGGTNLGVKIKSFTAERRRESTVLNWKTISESNLRHYEVQYSDDGRNFNTIGFVTPKGDGNTLVPEDYTFTDEPRTNKSYYRLKIVETVSNPVVYSNVVTMDKLVKSVPDVVVYPNPNTGTFSINVDVTTGYDIKVLNAMGQSVAFETIEGAKDFSIKLTNPNPGFYYVVTDANGTTHTSKVFVQ